MATLENLVKIRLRKTLFSVELEQSAHQASLAVSLVTFNHWFEPSVTSEVVYYLPDTQHTRTYPRLRVYPH